MGKLEQNQLPGEGEHIEQLNRIISDVTSEVQEEAAANNTNVFNLVPEPYKHHVQLLAEKNYPFYNRAINNDVNLTQEQFLNMMALNWIVKFRSFHIIAQNNGFRPVLSDSLDNIRTVPVAAMTMSASYVLLGATQDDGSRAMDYIRIPLRSSEAIDSASYEAGVELRNVPLFGPMVLDTPRGRLTTSPVIVLYELIPSSEGKDPELSRANFHKDLVRASRTINQNTIVNI
jgi:hypothetical protein